ncbi:MAG: DUF4382 domain-containing protein [Acidobacteriota bacterium]
MKLRIGLSVLIASVGLATACETSSTPGALTGSETGQLTIKLTDAPFPFAEVKSVDVFVVRIDAKASSADSAESASESDMSGWRTLVTPNALINLLDYANGKTLDLGTASVSHGTYRGFRMIIDTDKSSVTLNDGTKPNVKWPSAGKNGLKIKLEDPVVIPGTSALVLDFDVGRSFVMRGNSLSQNGLLFKPVIHASVVSGGGGTGGGTGVTTGSVSGSVRADSPTGPAVHNATVELLKSGTPITDTNHENIVRTGHTDASGNFTLTGIPGGTYVLRATPHGLTGYKPALLVGGVTITAGAAVTGKVIVVNK